MTSSTPESTPESTPQSTPRWRWYLHRFQSMSPGEFVHRVQEKIVQASERLEINRPSRQLSIGHDPLTGGPLASHLEQLFATKHCLPRQEECLALADQIIAGRLHVFGNDYLFPTLTEWHTDPKSGNRWPMRFYTQLDTRDGRSIGGVKYVWEVNRCHHLVSIAKAYWLSGKSVYADAVLDAIESWIDQNPYLMGVNWTSALEVALRLINWTWALALLGPQARLNHALGHKICQSIYEQGHYIYHHLSAHSSANNHLIGEATGLAIVGLCHAWLPQQTKWRQVGLTILEAEIEKQILPDGVPAEQAIEYLAFVLDFHLITWPLAARAGIAAPPIWAARLSAACDFLTHLMDRRGHVPHIGDGDNGRVFSSEVDGTPEANNYRSILASAAAILKRPELKAVAGQWDEKSYWLLGEEGRQTYDTLPESDLPLASRAFRSGGYCTLRAGDSVVSFDCGPLGYLSTAAHGHADALSLTVSVGGTPILIDPGTYAYQEGGRLRDYFRSTSAHNTVVVDGQNQSEMQGTFLWGRKANTKLLYWHSTPEHDIAVAEHDGYAGRGVLHRRTVIYDKPDWLYVIDRLLGTTPHTFEQLWHFPAGTVIEEAGGLHWVSLAEQRIAILRLEMPEFDVKCYSGLEFPTQGWVSERYGHLSPAPVLGFCQSALLPVTMLTAIALNPECTEIEPGAELKMSYGLDTEKSRQKIRARIDLLERQVHL